MTKQEFYEEFERDEVLMFKNLDKVIAHANMQNSRSLLNLLAIIHRDGGHYTEEHGIEKSVKDAMLIVAELIVK